MSCRRSFVPLFLVLVLLVIAVVPVSAQDRGKPQPIRFATFNASLNRFNAGRADHRSVDA